jgi:hypothetical protein
LFAPLAHVFGGSALTPRFRENSLFAGVPTSDEVIDDGVLPVTLEFVILTGVGHLF